MLLHRKRLLTEIPTRTSLLVSHRARFQGSLRLRVPYVCNNLMYLCIYKTSIIASSITTNVITICSIITDLVVEKKAPFFSRNLNDGKNAKNPAWYYYSF